jgi:hypothetical protein
LRGIAKAHNITLELCYQIGECLVVNSLPSSPHLGLIRSDDLESCRAGFNKPAIDCGDIRYVCGSGGTNYAFRHRADVVRLFGATFRSLLAWMRNSLPLNWIACSHFVKAAPGASLLPLVHAEMYKEEVRGLANFSAIDRKRLDKGRKQVLANRQVGEVGERY